MSSNQEFVIENGVLTKYNGPGGAVAVPEGVTKIAVFAFGGCTGLTQVVFPDSLTQIGDLAFKNCAGLTEVVFPDSLTEIGCGAFEGCTGLTEVVFPDSLTEIGYGAFEGCTGLTSVTLPLGLQKLGAYAFRNTNVRNLFQVILAGCKSTNWPVNDIPSAAAVYLTSTAKGTKALCELQLHQNENESVAAMTALLSAQKVKPTIYKRAAEFALECGGALGKETLFVLYDALTAAKAKKAAELLEEAVAQRKAEEDSRPEEAAGHPIEAFCRAHYAEVWVKRLLSACGLTLEDLPAVLYKDREESAPPFVLGCVLADYVNIVEKDKWSIEEEISFHKNADEIASALDQEALQRALERVYATIENQTLDIVKHYLTKTRTLQVSGILKARKFLIPYCRFGSPQQIRKVISNMNAWMDWGRYEKPGRQAVYLAQYALCLSSCREAILWADKNGFLEFAAELRGTDEQTLQDTVLMDFGLEEDGRKTYDLGGKR